MDAQVRAKWISRSRNRTPGSETTVLDATGTKGYYDAVLLKKEKEPKLYRTAQITSQFQNKNKMSCFKLWLTLDFVL